MLDIRMVQSVHGCMNNESISTTVAEYILQCRVEGKSYRTVQAYEWTLQRFLKISDRLNFPKIPSRLTRSHILQYLAEGAHLSEETRHRYFREVRCFFNWLADHEQIERSPFHGIKNVRLPARTKQPFSVSQIANLENACPNTAVGLRDKAMITVLLDTGIRCSELVSLEIGDLELATRRILVRFGKGNKQRVVSYADRCQQALEAYLAVRQDTSGPLFFAADGQGSLKPGVTLQPNGLKQMLRRLGKRAKVSNVHAHRFRHTFATWAIQHDARELDVQYLLGHSTSDMVRRYSSTYRSEQAAQRHANFSPADQMIG